MAAENTITQYRDLMYSLNKKEYKPFYVLDGEESFFIDKIVNHIENEILDESIREYSLFTYYGKDVSPSDMISACHQSSFVSPQIIIILKEAQNMNGFEKLENYFKQPNPNAIFVVAYKGKKIDGKTKVAKAIKSNGVYFHSKPLYDNQVPDWIIDYTKSRDLKIQSTEANLLYSYLGNDLSKIANELEKLEINLAKGSQITGKDIENYIGISREFNVFELSKILTNKDAKALFRMLNHFRGNPNSAPMVVMIANLARFFIQLLKYHQHSKEDKYKLAARLGTHFAFIKDFELAAKQYPPAKAQMALMLIYDYNKKAVGIGTQAKDIDLLTELSFRLFHA